MNTIYLNEEIYKVLSNHSNHHIGCGFEKENWYHWNWKSVTHYYQAQKHIRANTALFWKIAWAKTPQEAILFGKLQHPELKSYWKRIWFKLKFNLFNASWKKAKYGVMKKAILSKVIQHQEVRDTLLQTGNSQLVIESPNLYWGVNEHDEGQNKLGQIFMEVRTAIQQKGTLEELTKKFLPIPVWIKYPWPEGEIIRYNQGIEEGYKYQFLDWYESLSQTDKQHYLTKYPVPEFCYFMDYLLPNRFFP